MVNRAPPRAPQAGRGVMAPEGISALAESEAARSADGRRPLRILHVFDHSVPLQSGYTFRSLSILQGQRALGWETAQLTTPRHLRASPPEEAVDGLVFHRTVFSPGPLFRLPLFRELGEMAATTERLEALARAWRPDVLHAHSPVLNAIPALRVRDRLGIPVVYEVRACWEDAAVSHGTAREGGPRYRAARRIETWAALKADRLTTICEGLRADFIARGVPEAKITVIPNAVDAAAFAGQGHADPALAAALGLAGKTVLGFIGSFYAYEGLHVLLEAMPRLLAARGDVALLLVGGGPEDARLRALAAALGLGDAVVFTGRVPHEEVGRYYDLVDIFVYPRVSIRLTETVTPLKPLEAMAERRIVVASDVGGHRELIRDGDTGTLFRADDPDDLAAAVLATIARRAEWDAQRERARRFVEAERSWAASVARYRAVYEAVLDAGGKGPERI